MSLCRWVLSPAIYLQTWLRKPFHCLFTCLRYYLSYWISFFTFFQIVRIIQTHQESIISHKSPFWNIARSNGRSSNCRSDILYSECMKWSFICVDEKKNAKFHDQLTKTIIPAELFPYKCQVVSQFICFLTHLQYIVFLMQKTLHFLS